MNSNLPNDHLIKLFLGLSYFIELFELDLNRESKLVSNIYLVALFFDLFLTGMAKLLE